MDYQGILVVVTIIITLLAIANPIQRKTLGIFVPVWLIFLALTSSIGIIIFRSAIYYFSWELYSWSDFLTELLAFLIPMICISISLFLWYRAKLSKKKDERFKQFIQTSINEGKFDELKRILDRNIDRIEEVLKLDTINLLYNRRTLDSLNIYPDWIFLKILSKERVIQSNKSIFRITDVLVYDLIKKEDSILKKYISWHYGGNKHADLQDYELNLIEVTFQNPTWYMDVRADYPLLVIARNAIKSGNLDESYNQNSDLYFGSQGKRGRYDCPIHIAIKAHVLVLKQAVENGIDMDFYVSNLFHIFQFCVNHSIYNKTVWDSLESNFEYPTSFAYLIKEILHDFQEVLTECLEQNDSQDIQLHGDIVRMYSVSIYWLLDSDNKVSDNFKICCLKDFFEYAMELRWKPAEIKENQKDAKSINVAEALIKELSILCNGKDYNFVFILKAIKSLDIGMKSVSDNRGWLKNKFGIEDKE